MITILLIVLAVIAIVVMSIYAPTPAPCQLPPTKVEAPMPPVTPPKPQLSCLARGIIWSLKNELAKWQPVGSDVGTLTNGDLQIGWNTYSGLLYLFVTPTGIWNALSQADRDAITTAFAALLNERADEKVRPIREAFEKLGCPDQP